KRRGITIDLGFAHDTDDRGRRLAFVDVPGHERFVHNMLAGVAGIDAVLLVVAADEGVMPQTREHLHICNLLRVPAGLVVLTRTDLVDDPEMIELCTEEIQELTEGTFLAGCPVIPVSSVTGAGLPELRKALGKLPGRHDAKAVELPFRMPVDRAFTIKGFGTVVTGTVISGAVSTEEEVWQYPEKRAMRIRGLQAQSEAVSQVQPGQRVAVNLAGVAREEIQRGHQLAAPDSLATSYMLNVELHLIADETEPLATRRRIRLHLGTQEVMGRVVLLGQDTLVPGATGLAQLRLEAPVSSRFGDRFILRNFSPLTTLGGGRVLDPLPAKSRRTRSELPTRLERIRSGEEEAQLEEIVFLQGVQGVMQAEFPVRTGLSAKQVQRCLQPLQSRQRLVCLDSVEKRWLHPDHLERIGHFVLRLVDAHHQRFPDRQGMTRPELVGKLALLFAHEREVETLLKLLVKQEKLVQTDGAFALPSHVPEVSGAQEALLEQCLRIISEGGFQPLRRTHLLEQLGMGEKAGLHLLKSATHHKQLVRVSEDLHYTPDQLHEIRLRLETHFQSQPTVTVIEFKELLGITRKYAVELLEHFDTQRLTVRQDNLRIPGLLKPQTQGA
ncbi:MAG TPA: selenocysteine-specific translation elongation factor, partial [Deltaproteobacteria bacterium]|nr:selenocysteine-specific translation elongation factor [Deltaproteobacteria bacterium]